MATNSRICVVLLAGNQSLRLLFACKFSGKLWIHISQCSIEFLVSVCKVAKFTQVTFCRNCRFRQVGGLLEIYFKVWTKRVYPKVPTLYQ
jgi:hypothetical protein